MLFVYGRQCMSCMKPPNIVYIIDFVSRMCNKPSEKSEATCSIMNMKCYNKRLLITMMMCLVQYVRIVHNASLLFNLPNCIKPIIGKKDPNITLIKKM